MIDSKLETAIRNSWKLSTASADREWLPTNPAAGHCDVTALLLRERHGGDLKMAKVFRDGTLSEHHYWNVLSDGTEVDLTKEQFDGSEEFVDIVTLSDEFFATVGPMQPGLVTRLQEFGDKVDVALQGGI